MNVEPTPEANKRCCMQQARAYEGPIAMVLEYMARVAPTDASAARDLAFLIAFFNPRRIQ